MMVVSDIVPGCGPVNHASNPLVGHNGHKLDNAAFVLRLESAEPPIDKNREGIDRSQTVHRKVWHRIVGVYQMLQADFNHRFA